MFVITVVPLKRGIALDALSYFSSIEYGAGTIVSIPVRNATTFGLVTETKEVSTAKTALRAATFSLKKLPAQSGASVLGKASIDAARDIALKNGASLGAVLYNLLPPEIRNGDSNLPHTHHVKPGASYAPQVLEATKADRYLTYRSLIRETFAHSGSVLFVVPSSAEVADAEAALTQGIADRVITMSSARTRSEMKRAFAALEDFSKTHLIIATPSYAFVERHDITMVIIEHARSPHYKELTRPYLDYRDVITTHAKHLGRKVIIGDLLPRTEDEARRRRDEYGTLGETPKRIELSGTLQVVDMKRKPDAESTPAFSLFSDTVIEHIKDVRKKKGFVFLFAARRGLAPMVACLDCGSVVRSKECGAPYSLLRTMKNGVEERWFVCSTSGERIRAEETCRMCGSWRLRERGIGIQHVYDELHKLLPGAPIILFDHITAKTYKKATFLRDTFYSSKGGAILLGTTMALPYLTKHIDLSVVVNMDALLATPTWRLEEENLALLLGLREVTDGPVYVQTRTPDAPVLGFAKQGSVEHFYTDEIALRKSFNYPPFSVFVHLTWQGPAAAAKSVEEHIKTVLAAYDLSIYQNPSSTKEVPVMYGLIRVPEKEWPNPTLARCLLSLPPAVRIVINPDRIV